MPEVLDVKHWKDDDELHERGWVSMEDLSKDLSYPLADLEKCWFVEIYEGSEDLPMEMNVDEIPPGEDIELTVYQVIHGRLFGDVVKLRVLKRLSDEHLIAVPLDTFACN